MTARRETVSGARRLLDALGVLCIALLAPMLCKAEPTWLDNEIGTFEAPAGSELIYLCRKLTIPCGYEESAGHRIEHHRGQDLRLTRTSPRKVLEAITKRYSAYLWTVEDGVLILEPKKREGEDILATKIDRFSVTDTISVQAAALLSFHVKWVLRFSEGSGMRFDCIDLALSNVTLRQALGAIAKADGQAAWIVSYDQGLRPRQHVQIMPWRSSGGVGTFDYKRRRFLPIGSPKFIGGCKALGESGDY